MVTSAGQPKEQRIYVTSTVLVVNPEGTYVVRVGIDGEIILK
jgi:hypothetical protein